MKGWFAQGRDKLGHWIHRLAQWVGGKSYGGLTAASARVSVDTPDIRPEEFEFESSRPYEQDWLGRAEFGAGLSRLAQYGSGSGVVLLDGHWGCGKTTFIQMWASSMRNEGRTVIEVNAWSGDYADSPFDDMVMQLGRGLSEQHKGLRSFAALIVGMPAGMLTWAHGLKALKVIVESLDPNAITSVAKLIWALWKAGRRWGNRERRMTWLKARLTVAARFVWRRRRKSLVIVIDELDRCRPDYALRFLEMIKHVFEVPYVTFVVAANADELGNAVNGVYGADFDGKGYIERFFDIWLPLPVGDRANFVQRCLEKRSFKAAAGKEVSFDVGTYCGAAEGAAARLLEASSLSPRQIKKAVKHLTITLLFNRSDDDQFAATVVFVGLVRHIAPAAYDAIESGADDDELSNRLLGGLSGTENDVGTAAMARELIGWVRCDESKCEAARRALDSISLGGDSIGLDSDGGQLTRPSNSES